MQPITRTSGAERTTHFCDACGHANRVAARFCASCGADIPEQLARTPLQLARSLWAKGELLQAQSVLETELAIDPSNELHRLGYATLLLQAGEWENGLEQLWRLSPLSAHTPVVQAYIGGALLGLNRVSEAKDVIDAAFTEWPNDLYVLLKRGELYCRLGIYRTAVEALEHVGSMNGVDPTTREAVRRLLRFAREKNRSGFVRYFPTRIAGWSFKPRLRLGKPRADTVWGT